MTRKKTPALLEREIAKALKHAAGAKRRAHTIYDLVEVNTRTKQSRVLHANFSTKADAQEAATAYKDRKRPGIAYHVKARRAPTPAYRWNPED